MFKKLFGNKDNDTVEELLNHKRDNRDHKWVNRFYKLIPNHQLFCDNLEPVYGPDGLPYIRLFLKPHTNTTTLKDVAPRCIEYGLGVTLITEEHKEPDWVFGCGDLVSLANFGAISLDEQRINHQNYVVGENEDVLLGQPSEQYLPPSIRSIIKQDLENTFNIENPSVLLMFNSKMTPPYSMVFALSKEDFGGDNDLYEHAMRRIAWHLPSHCPATSMPGADFEYYPL